MQATWPSNLPGSRVIAVEVGDMWHVSLTFYLTCDITWHRKCDVPQYMTAAAFPDWYTMSWHDMTTWHNIWHVMVWHEMLWHDTTYDMTYQQMCHDKCYAVGWGSSCGGTGGSTGGGREGIQVIYLVPWIWNRGLKSLTHIKAYFWQPKIDAYLN